MVINQKAILKILIVAILVTFLLTLVDVKPVYAGAPWNPELVSPANNSQGDGNPPQLCAKNMGDPEGDPVQIRFEVWGGSEADHISPWIDAGNTGNIVCWRDSAPWTTETHAWAARAVDNHGEQSGGSPAWAVQIPSSPTPVPICTVDDLTVSPPAPQPVGTVLSIYASASCSNGVSSLRFSTDGNVIGTVSGASGSVNWNTTGAAATAHTITVEAADGTGTIRKSRSTNYDLTSGAPPPTQQVTCSIDSFNVSPSSPQPQGTSVSISGSASCNTGVRAIRLKVDGGIQWEIGSTSINYSWDTSGWSIGNHTIVIEAAGIGDNSWTQAASSSKTYRLEGTATNTPAPNPQTYFQTGEVIQIGYDIFVIVDGQRRLVPNPETLDALGIPRSWIDNKGFSDTELSQIPRGLDIPDVNRDPSGFQDFKNRIFPNASPIIPQQPSQPPTNYGSLSLIASPSTVAPSGYVTAAWTGLTPTGNDWISLHPAGSPDSNYLSWQYAQGSSGSVSFSTPSQTGQYEFRLFRNGQKIATSNVFTVTGSLNPANVPTQPENNNPQPQQQITTPSTGNSSQPSESTTSSATTPSNFLEGVRALNDSELAGAFGNLLDAAGAVGSASELQGLPPDVLSKATPISAIYGVITTGSQGIQCFYDPQRKSDKPCVKFLLGTSGVLVTAAVLVSGAAVASPLGVGLLVLGTGVSVLSLLADKVLK